MENPEDATVEPVVRLTSKLDINELISKGSTEFEVNFDDLGDDIEQPGFKPEEVYQYLKPECCDLQDEDVYQEGQPFEKLAKNMTSLLEDGKIKKRILREGYGSELPDGSLVTVDYNAYVEFGDEPFDSTYLRKRPHTFALNGGKVIVGLEIAVKSMKLNEKAQFLIAPEFAYGALGCFERVPPNSTVLFEIEVKNCVDAGASVAYPHLSEERQKDFLEIYKYAHALISKAKDLYGKNLYKQAIREYNIAVSKLEMCTLRDYSDQEKQQELLLRLYTNLAVASTKTQQPRLACRNCNKVYNMCEGTSLQVPAKIYFHHARALIQLGNYNTAEKYLKLAQKKEPNNVEVSKEFVKLNALKKEAYIRDLALSKAIFKNTEINREPHEKSQVTNEFKVSIADYCKELLGDANSMQYVLPELTEEELAYCRQEVGKHELVLLCSKHGGAEKYFIAKPSPID